MQPSARLLTPSLGGYYFGTIPGTLSATAYLVLYPYSKVTLSTGPLYSQLEDDILVLLFQLKLHDNMVKVVSRYAVGSVTVYIIRCLSASCYACRLWHFDSWGATPTRPLSRLSGKVTWWELPFKSQNAEACIHVDTGFVLLVKPQTTEEEGAFLLVMLCIRPFAKTSDNENKVESNGILKISLLVSNYFYKVSKKWRIKCTMC